MKILLVNYRYFISGGPEKYMFNIKRLLEEHGHEVIPFSVHSNKNAETEYSKYFVEPIGGRDSTYFEDCRKTPRTIWKMLSRSVYSMEVKKAVQREIREQKPDLVYIIHFVNKLSPSVIRGARQMDVPVVLRLSDYFLLCPRFDFLCRGKVCEDCLKKGYRTCLKRRCVKGSLFASAVRVLSMKIHSTLRIYDDVDAFIAPSEFLKKKLEENGFGRGRIYCVPTFAASQTPDRGQRVGTYGLYFGRLSEEKGVDTVVHAYERLPEHLLKIVGDDTTAEAERLKQYVKEHGIKNIEFSGFKSGAELEEAIGNARFVIVPSIWYDNLPNTALESFQHSKPVIASRIGSLPELVADGKNGYLFTPGNAKELAEKIKRMEDAGRVRDMGMQGKLRLNYEFSPERHYEMLMGVFEQACKNARTDEKP